MISRRRFLAISGALAGTSPLVARGPFADPRASYQDAARRLRADLSAAAQSAEAEGASASLAEARLQTQRAEAGGFSRAEIIEAPGRVIGADGTSAPDSVELVRRWDGSNCRSRVVNNGTAPVRVKEIVLFELTLALPMTTALYGEGFQMLSQTGGTIGAPSDFSQYTDAKHYRMPATTGSRAYYGLLTLTPPGEETRVLAFTSCARFSGRLEVAQAFRPADPGSPKGLRYVLRAVVDAEGLELAPREAWTLEELMFASGGDRAKLLSDVAAQLAGNHPPLRTSQAPTGWCSWYCFGPRVTAQQVLDNLDVIAKRIPSLKYIQIDDGYQSAMGDWLDTGAAFGGDVRTVLDQIRKRGFEPAIWVAPFVAEEGSRVFQQHRDWFIKDEEGAPLRSDRVTFGGWRRGPWYALDGTHPEAQQHLERVFRTMRDEWGCTYFKLDANFWGAMHGGRFYDAKATRIEAYRRGMQAILRGAGNAFILGCNHPIWPSIGVVHGSRSSNDIKRTWDRIATTARQNLSRNWQNGRFWWNDPDAVCLASDLTDAECQFHATAIYASGGMVLSGDDLTVLPLSRAAMLQKLLPPTGIAAEFDDASLRVGTVKLANARMMCLFNWDDTARPTSFRLAQPSMVTDYWTDESLGRRQGTMTIEMPPRSARLLKLT
jgi:alpha-galactosidase